MPSRAQTVQDAVGIFSEATRQYGDTSETAWLGIYSSLLWYEVTGLAEPSHLPHINEASALRGSATRGLKVWQRRALDVERYVAQRMGCLPSKVRGRVDGLMNIPAYRDLQRQNSLGIAFVGLIRHVLARYGNGALNYEIEKAAQEVFPGIDFPGRSKAPSIDLLVRREKVPRAVISMKWSLRHDRINDLTNECPSYKQAAVWRRQNLLYIVVTNEYDPARLDKVISDTCIDSVVHVHKPAVVDAAALDGRADSLLDLSDLCRLTLGW